MSRRYSYYPGCSLHASAREYDQSTRAVCAAFGVELAELKDWNCCGATSAHATEPEFAHAMGLRNLILAEARGDDIVTPCAACYSRLKSSEHEAKEGQRPAAIPTQAESFRGRITTRHLLDVVANDVGEERVRASVKKPLGGMKLAAYYGCLLTRPRPVTDFDDSDDPMTLDILLRAIGATPVSWSYKTDCCGASFSVPDPDIVVTMVGKLAEMAREAGAEGFVTACPLCQLNLDTRQAGAEPPLPVFFFTELLGYAMDLPGASRWFAKHMISPMPLLRQRQMVTT